MEALGLLFVGTSLLLLIGHAAEVFGRHRPAGSNSVRRHTPFLTYLLGGPETGTALSIDPVLETVRCDLHRLGGLGLELRYVLETYVHVEHIVEPRWGSSERGAALTAKQSPLPRFRVRLRKLRVGWNKSLQPRV